MGNVTSHSGGVAVTTKSTEKGSSTTQNIQYAVSGMQGLRHTMEDRHLQCDHIPIDAMGELMDHSIFAVFDGHGGDFTSNYLHDNFLAVLSKRAELQKYASLPKSGMKSRSDVTGVQLLRQALVRTFVELDQELIPLQQERNRAILSGKITPPPPLIESDEIAIPDAAQVAERSGSTAVVVVITPTHYICANTGDSRAVLRRNGKVLPLSFDHKPSDVPERRRVEAAGGVVKAKRVDGDLAVSRAFGDFTYKQDKNRSIEKQKVIVVPDLLVYPRNLTGDEFIVIACDGIWDVASNKQCTEFVQTLLNEGEIDLGNICEEALDTCLDRNSRDNMTMMLIRLPGIKFDSSSSALVNNALWGHRSARKTRSITRVTTEMTHNACISVGKECMNVEEVFAK
jgi:serine/threonine protein phosphatase PrpC